jgi:hypothetical protein
VKSVRMNHSPVCKTCSDLSNIGAGGRFRFRLK